MFDDHIPGDQSEYARSKRHVGRGVLDHLSNFGGAVANAVGLPVSSVLDAINFQNPIDQWRTPFTQENRMSGRDHLRLLNGRANSYMPGWGQMISPHDTWGNFAAGMAAETALDPTTLIPGRSLAKAVKTRNAAVAAQNGAVAKNAAAQASNLLADQSVHGMTSASREFSEQLPHHVPAFNQALPFEHAVDVLQPSGGFRKSFPLMSHDSLLKAEYGTPFQQAEAMGHNLGGTNITPIHNTKMATLGNTLQSRAFYADNVPFQGAVHAKNPHIIFLNRESSTPSKFNAVHHEMVHSMIGQHPEMLGELYGRSGNPALNEMASQVPWKLYGYGSQLPTTLDHVEESIAHAVGNAALTGAKSGSTPIYDMMKGLPGNHIEDFHSHMQARSPSLRNQAIANSLGDFMTGAMHNQTAIVPSGPLQQSSRYAPKSFAELPSFSQEMPQYKPLQAVPKVNNAPVYSAGGLTAASLVGRKKSQDKNNGLSGYQRPVR